MKKYGILLIGCGYIGCEHLKDIYYRPEFEIVAVVDKSEERAALAAKKYNALSYGKDYKPFLSDKRIQIVIIATYPDTHLKIAKECLLYGKHVLCEKPIARTFEESLKFYNMALKSKCKVQVAYILRHNKSYHKIKELIDSKIIGELKVIRMVQNQHISDWSRYCSLLENCMPIVDCGVHYIDIVRWFTGSEITKVSGFGTKIDEDSPKYNYTIMNFETENGCQGFYESCWSRNVGAQNVKEFIGTEGRITLTLAKHRGEEITDGDLIRIYSKDSEEYRSICYKSVYKDMYAQILSLINNIENDTPTVPSLEDVFKAQQIALEAEKAILNKIPVSVESHGVMPLKEKDKMSVF